MTSIADDLGPQWGGDQEIVAKVKESKQFFFTSHGCPIRTFDELTAMGFMLDLVTGMYYKP